jgi:hypothetical protein
MKRSELIAELLVELKIYRTLAAATTSIQQTFKREFPFWNFSEWDQFVPDKLVKSMRFRATLLRCENLNQVVARFDSIEQAMYK